MVGLGLACHSFYVLVVVARLEKAHCPKCYFWCLFWFMPQTGEECQLCLEGCAAPRSQKSTIFCTTNITADQQTNTGIFGGHDRKALQRKTREFWKI